MITFSKIQTGKGKRVQLELLIGKDKTYTAVSTLLRGETIIGKSMLKYIGHVVAI